MLARLQRRDSDALAEVFAIYGDRVYSICRRLTGCHADAEDAVQEVFLRLLDQAGSFSGQSSFSTWLFRVAVNHTINLGRRNSQRQHRSLEAIGADSSLPEAGLGPLQSVLAGEERQLLDQALQQLPEQQRSIVVLRELEGLGYAAIAAVLDLPEGTVNSRLVRGRQRLLEILHRRLPDHEVSKPVDENPRPACPKRDPAQ